MSNDKPKTEAPKTEALNPDQLIVDAVAKALEKALPMASGVMAKTLAETQRGYAQVDRAVAQASKPSGSYCQFCKQILANGVTSETHPHRQIAVYPSNRKHGKWFQGVWINGIC